ncbi:MAG TPA: hypothetical protein VHM19_06995, partial [Polyangiales bacterium]|nr:hypothetical protein [Polyangiales bacterium]
MRNSRRGAALAWLFVVVSCGFAAIACGKGGGKVPHPGTGKAPPIFDGGAQGTLDGSGPGLGFDGSANGCNYVGSQLDPTQYDQCPMCTHARCLLTGLVPKDMQTQLADCPDGVSKCVPDPYVQYMGVVLLPSCKSLSGLEGRCVSVCVPSVAAQADRLPRDVCKDDERCAPCYDPITGEDTGSCHVGCDPGPVDPPKKFARCCHDLGACVPSDDVPVEQRSLLGKESCAQKDELCAPDTFTAPAGFVPASCKSIDGAEGRCIPDCIPSVESQAKQLPRSSCGEHELCAPCYDPVTAKSTGACNLSNDPGPKNPPQTFPECCGGDARCVPKSLVPKDQQALLGHDSCKDAADLCVPNDLAADPSASPSICASWDGAEGRCLLACLPDVAKNAANLTRGACKKGFLCSPCFDPLTGEDTGACRVGGDPGPKGPPYTFPECCGGASRCVPKPLVPSDQQSLLGQDSCSEDTSLCVPKTLIADQSFVPATCSASIGNAEGRCLLACLPDVAKNASVLTQDGCASGELCTPCFDPASGADTGACHVGGDTGPTQSPYTFPECCGGLSACVPKTLVPDDQEPLLGQDSCSDSASLCVPKTLASDPQSVAPSCMSWNGAEGRCLPACLPSVAANAANLTKGSCSAGELCSPCYDPVTGVDTGACHIGGDPGPENAPYEFPDCCGTASQCIPKALVPDAQEPLLSQGGCSDVNSLCVPKALAANPALVPTTCSSWNGAEGRCLSTCLPSVSANAANLTKDICASGELCSPCYDPVTGIDTGACHVGGDTGPKSAPYTFPTCCSGASQCIPKALVPDAQEAML